MRLGLQDAPVDEAIRQIKADENAGPVLNALERCMHDPQYRGEADLAELLKPLESIEIDESRDFAPDSQSLSPTP